MIVGVIIFHGNSSLMFTIANIIAILSEQGHEVHFFQNAQRNWGVKPIEFDHPVHLHYFHLQSSAYEYSKKNLLDIWHVARFVHSKVDHYDVIIGVDQNAFIAAWLMKLCWKARKLVYLSMEIILAADYAYKGRYFAIKHGLEKAGLWFTNQLWIQDQFRGKALTQDLKQPNFPLTILPHSPRRIRDSDLLSTYLRDKYKISSTTKILVYTGGIDPTYHSIELAEMAAQSAAWGKDAVLVMHGFGDDAHLNYLAKIQNDRFIFSTGLVSFAELDELIASADIGIALFNPSIDTNHRLMTSGKIMNYLKAGIPVIATRTPTTQDVLERHGAGICIEGLTEISTACRQISEDYQRYSIAATYAFATEYEFEQNFNAAWTQLIKS